MVLVALLVRFVTAALSGLRAGRGHATATSSSRDQARAQEVGQRPVQPPERRLVEMADARGEVVAADGLDPVRLDQRWPIQPVGESGRMGIRKGAAPASSALVTRQTSTEGWSSRPAAWITTAGRGLLE